MAAKRKNITNDQGEHPADAEYATLMAFEGSEYALDFCIDEGVGERRVSLIHDTNPDGGEQVPDEDTLVPETTGRAEASYRRLKMSQMR